MKIALVDADLLDGGTKHPNLVIMKLSGYYKNKGCSVRLIEDYKELIDDNYSGVSQYEKIFISKVFDWTVVDEKLLTFENVEKGGTGFYYDKAPPLPQEIEHFMPDYHIYDLYIEHDTKHPKEKNYFDAYKNYSMGFATRGCFRQCAFCVNKNYKKVSFHSHVKEWIDPSRPYIYLWDDNILGYAGWRDVFQELKEINKPFQFKQGMDLRLMTKEKAELISSCRYHGDFIFAFDHVEDKDLISKKLEIWRNVTSKSTKLYVLCGFDGLDEKEIENIFIRLEVIMKYKCIPYLCRHQNYLQSEYKDLIIQLARWCNQPSLFKKKSFREYCHFCQEVVKKKCAAIRALEHFENKCPEIAERYFDMKYEYFN